MGTGKANFQRVCKRGPSHICVNESCSAKRVTYVKAAILGGKLSNTLGYE